ncbi:MAG TPA: alpha/beta hydrolase [Acidimicrobiia bacterium]|nr:alpha/beta hydrolase [Acidimicrobiia bacterium]
MKTKVGGFRSEEARRLFLDLYDRATEELWPIPSTELEVDTSYGTTRVRRCGQGPGLPLILIHGHSGTSVGWYKIIAPIAEAHEVFVIDVIGALGRSVQTRPIETTSHLADWLAEVLDGLGLQRAHLLGYSEGGFVAFHAALDKPDRIASLVAIDAAGTVESVKTRFLASMIWAGLQAAIGVPGVLRRFGERLTPGVEFSDLWWEMVTVGARGFRHALPMPKRVSDDQLRRLTTPTLLYMAGESEVYDAAKAATRANALIPNVETIVVEGAGHGLPLTHAERTWADVLDFVDRYDTTVGQA